MFGMGNKDAKNANKKQMKVDGSGKWAWKGKDMM